jgi:uncharacterized membrane protein
MKIIVALVHLVFATTWLGSVFFYNFVLMPELRKLDAAAEVAVSRAVSHAMRPLLGISALVTIVSGLVMMVQLHSQHPGSFSSTRWGLSLIVGAVLSLLVVAMVLFVQAPAGRKLVRLANNVQGREPESDERRQFRHLRSTISTVGWLSTIVLFLALATMAIARYS